jgi:hypothetical protein
MTQHEIPYVKRLREDLVSAIGKQSRRPLRSLASRTLQGRPVFVGVLVALLLVVGVGFPLAALSILGDSRRGQGPSSGGATGAVNLRPVLTGTTQLDRGIIDIEASHDSVWAITYSGVRRIDPTTNSVVADIPVERIENLN